VDVIPINISTDSASLERGEHLVRTVGLCTECHGEKLQGKLIDDDPLFGTLVGKNLTAGRGVSGRTTATPILSAPSATAWTTTPRCGCWRSGPATPRHGNARRNDSETPLVLG
jgi:hypothetical protein